MTLRPYVLPVAAMAVVVLASNVLVQHPFTPFGLQDWLTWGAFSYPVAFLVGDLTNRALGAARTRRVVYVGFLLAFLLSLWLASPRVAVASATAFLAGQLLDVALFDRLRGRSWWLPPLVSSVVSSAVDTVIFFTLAFSCAGFVTQGFALLGIVEVCGEGLPWTNWALADWGVKLAMAALLIVPYRLLMPRLPDYAPLNRP